jgi:membrane-associated protein
VDHLAPGLLAILGLILVKEAGVPIPVPGDLVVIGAGVAARQGQLDPVVALVAIVVASIVGGVIQYGLLRTVARPALLRILGRVMPADRLEQQTQRLRRGGTRSVAIARSTPGIRIVAIAASALAAIPGVAFVTGLAIGNALFIAAHFGLGYLVGQPIVAAFGGALGPIAVVVVGLAVIGAVGWAIVSRRRGRAAVGSPVATALEWADACCPACLALAVIDATRPVQV